MKWFGTKDVLNRAAMTIYQFRTGVTRSTCGAGRLGVSVATNPEFRDCCTVSFMIETETGSKLWRYAHFSPARARIIAMHLLEQADELEGREGDPGMRMIDRSHE